jgi:hypothetical protein
MRLSRKFLYPIDAIENDSARKTNRVNWLLATTVVPLPVVHPSNPDLR